MKIVFFVSSLSQPRCIKRIKSFYSAGFDCEVYGYTRGLYDCNKYSSDINITELGQLESGSGYLRKMKVMAKDSIKILSKYSNGEVVFYSFSFLPALICLLKGKVYAYEISDVFYAYPKFSKIQWLLKSLDKKIIKKSKVTIMTSDGFKDYYGLRKDNIVVVPNKVTGFLRNCERKPLSCDEGNISFGFVGSVGYHSVMNFAETIGRYYGNYSFHFFGGGADDQVRYVKQLVEKYKNIYYHGPFVSPDDLEKIYNQLDIVIACYDVHSLNERIAEPNKLYEAGLFCKPIVVSNNTFLGRKVLNKNMGFAIDASSEYSIHRFLEELDINTIKDISMRLYRMPIEDFIYDDKELLSHFDIT